MIDAIRPGTIPFAVASCMVASVCVLYFMVIASQGDLDAPVVWFFAVLLIAVTIATLAAAFVLAADVRVYVGVSAATLLLFAGVLGIFTIGMPLLGAGLFTLAGAARAARGAAARPITAFAVAAVTLVAATALFAAAFTISRQ